MDPELVDPRGQWFEWPFDPLSMLAALVGRRVDYVVIGGLAAIIRGAPLPTYDLDIAPADNPGNRARLTQALADLEAQVLIDGAFVDVSVPAAGRELHGAGLIQARTAAGMLDVHFHPDGTDGYRDLHRWASSERLAPDLSVFVASLLDVIRSKEAAGRERDTAALPAFRATLEISLEYDDEESGPRAT
jgi:hypothetical protein